MSEAAQLRSDTLTLLLSYRINQHLPATRIMKRIRECCQILIGRTTDAIMINAYRKIIQAIYACQYAEVVIMMHVAEDNYYRNYLR